MKKLKGFRKVFLIATVISLIFASCRHPQDDQNDPKVENVKVTVKKDSHVTKAPDSFTLVKGSKLGFTALKEKMTLEFEANYELSKITLNTSSGAEITNSAPYTFNADTTIYLCSQRQGSGPKLELKELKVDGNKIETILDVMNAPKTKKDKVKIETKASPADAEVLFEPNLSDNFWNLTVGNGNTLKIKVKKGSDEKIYTLNIERLDSSVATLQKLTVGDKSKEGAEITDEMTFTVLQDKTEVEVKAVTDPENAPIVFDPPLSGEKLALTGNETTLTIKVGTAPKVSTYTVKVIKLSSGGDFIDTLFIYGGRKNGVDSDVEKTEIDKILNNEENVVLEVAGPNATILAASKLKTWTSFKINGVKFASFPYSSYLSVSLAELKLPARGETVDVKLEVQDADGIGELNFKIKRTDETVDVPVDKLYIRDKNVLSSDARKALHDESQKPVFDGAEPSRIEVEAREDVMKSITIDGTPYNTVDQKTDANNAPIWTIEGSVTGVSPSGKDVTMVIAPNDTDAYHPITWTFHLNYKVAEVMKVRYEINGKNEYKLPPEFVEGINSGTNPLIDVESKLLNLKLTCGGKVANVKINDDVINGDTLVKVGMDYVLIHSIPVNETPKNITVEINPVDLGVYSPFSFKFQAKGNSVTEKINPTFEEISGDKNLPKATFIEKLSGPDKPLYKTASETADIVIDLPSYDYDFLCKEVRINDEKAEITVQSGFFGNFYKIKKSFAVSKTVPTDVKIEFIAKENISENLIWSFQLQGGGENPSLPQSQVSIFKINGIGGFYSPLPKDLTEHLTDGSNPTYEFDGKKALVEVGSYNDGLIENVVFKFEGEQKHEMAPVQEGYAYSSKYEFEIADTNPHDVEIIITPKDKKYSNLIYKFRLKWSGKKTPLPLIFGVNGNVQKNGYKATMKAETAQLLVQAKKDIMLEVYMGEENHEQKCNIITFQASSGTVWHSETNVSLLGSDGNAATKTFVIKVMPKDVENYEETICKYTLTGTKIADDNAEFVWSTGQYAAPKVLSHIEWMAGLDSNEYIDDYGAKAVTLEAHTVSTRAKVKYQFVDMEDKPIQGQEVKEMTNTNGVHKSEKIELFKDKPTRIKAWVLAADGTTTNDKKGIWKMTYNPCPLAWEYENKGDEGKGAEYKTKAYDLIEIEKGKVTDPGKKIYLVFAPWKEDDGYTVVNDGLPNDHQAAFVKIGAMGNLQEYYKTVIDVGKLLDNSVQELKATLKMKKNGNDCLTYDVKIKVKQ